MADTEAAPLDTMADGRNIFIQAARELKVRADEWRWLLRLVDLLEEHGGIEKDRRTREARVDALKAEEAEAVAGIAAAKERAEAAAAEVRAHAEAALAKARADLDAITARVKEKQEEFAALSGRVDAKTAEFSEVDGKLRRAREQLAEIRKNISG